MRIYITNDFKEIDFATTSWLTTLPSTYIKARERHMTFMVFIEDHIATN